MQKKIQKEKFNFTKMGMMVPNILADILYNVLKLNQPPKRVSEHRKLNKHITINSSKQQCPCGQWGGLWLNI